jgi:hypothetical protein
MDVHFFGKEENDTNQSIEEVEEEDNEIISSDLQNNSSSLSDEDQRMQDILKDL